MSYLFRALITSLLTGVFSSVAIAADVKEVFNGEMLGTTQRYFESVAGIPRQSLGENHTFRVKGCDITATIKGGSVSALHMPLSDTCRADLRSFIGDYAPAATSKLTFGAFAQTSGGDLRYLANCLTMCGNAYDPSAYAHWEGPRAAGFMQVLLEVVLVEDAAYAAASAWGEHMTKAAGEDYVMDTRFNCEARFDDVAAQAFKNVQVTAVTIGHELSVPGC
ncbi:hypothetical protein G9Q38_10560 [Pusillimonas sp. DMV24BSW_D]|uniref:hypothetical protein n=1 Tax=Neopusillimonas aestuarii TaxID=2716226 RepID=UPI0014087619|nr:hypothetical protein [Pusillimonas sp. DMV24BSW_D]QIM49585.1 hypothetical protein G9Q38_10560 [Pusillimonas sp. DMV24BSW_D]